MNDCEATSPVFVEDDADILRERLQTVKATARCVIREFAQGLV